MTLNEKVALLKKLNRELRESLAIVSKRYDVRLNEIIDTAEQARLVGLKKKIANFGT
ncbi:MAG: hypothetical protein AAB416_03250 [Patescibacteria group bacterium]